MWLGQQQGSAREYHWDKAIDINIMLTKSIGDRGRGKGAKQNH